MTHGALPLAAWVVSLVQKSLNGAVSNLILMSGYFCVTMSAMCSQAFFSTSEPDHMNQFRVTFPSLDSEDPELSPPPQPAMRTVAMAIETIEVRRDIRMPLLSESRLSTPIVVVGAGRGRRMRGRKVRHVHRYRPRRWPAGPRHPRTRPRPCRNAAAQTSDVSSSTIAETNE